MANKGGRYFMVDDQKLTEAEYKKLQANKDKQTKPKATRSKPKGEQQ